MTTGTDQEPSEREAGEGTADEQVETSFSEAAEAGEQRATRSLGRMFAVGVTGGIEIALGLMAYFLVLANGGSQTQAALAFGIGFVLLTLAGSELFTENFLVPIVALAAHRATVLDVVRLWVVTLLANLVGGAAMMGLLVVAFPDIHDPLREAAAFYTEQPIAARSMALALLGGATITVFTWIERGTDSHIASAVAAHLTGFLLLLGPLNHSVVGSLELIGAIIVGPEVGVGDWLGIGSWMVLGNAVGGIVLVTVLRFIRVGPAVIRRERRKGLQRAGFGKLG